VSDEDLRELERRAAQGDAEADARRAVGYCRVGHCACHVELVEARAELAELRALFTWPELPEAGRPLRAQGVPMNVRREERRMVMLARQGGGLQHPELVAWARRLADRGLRLIWFIDPRRGYEFEVVPFESRMTPRPPPRPQPTIHPFWSEA